MPLQELSASVPHLADSISRRAAEIVAVKGDPKRVLARRSSSPLPKANAINLALSGPKAVRRQPDTDVAAQAAQYPA